MVGEEGRGFGIDQRLDRGRPPMVVGDLVVGPRQRMDAAVDQRDEILDAAVVRLRLADQAADHAEDVAHAVVELGDQQLLPLVGLLALHRRLVGQAQHDLDQRRAQRLGDAQLPTRVNGRERPSTSSFHSSKLSRGVRRGPLGPYSTGLCGSPPQRTERINSCAEQHDIVARGARDRDGQHARGAVGEAFRVRDERGDLVGGEDAASSLARSARR